MQGSHTCLGSLNSSIRGQRLGASRPAPTSRTPFIFQVKAVAQAKAKPPKPPAKGERFRLSNLAPQPGSRDKEVRKGRGYGAGQGGSCGFGMRGQNSRSGPGTRAGFEGGQMPLYRRVPKLKGICGGNSNAIPKYVTINLGQLSAFKGSEEVTLESLKAKNILNVSGKQSKLPLKVLGDGELSSPLVISAEVFSSSAMKKIKKAGGKMVETPKKIKWTRKIGVQRTAAKSAAATPVKSKK